MEPLRWTVVVKETDNTESRLCREVAEPEAAVSCVSSRAGLTRASGGGTGGGFSGNENSTGEIGEGRVVIAAGGIVSDVRSEASERVRCTCPCHWIVMVWLWPTVALRLREASRATPRSGDFIDGDVELDIVDSSRRRPGRPTCTSACVLGWEQASLIETVIGTSPRIRLSFLVFRSSFIFSLGSKPSASGRGSTGCSCFKWSDAGKTGVRGEPIISRGAGGGDFLGASWSLRRWDVEDCLEREKLRLREKLLRFGFGESMAQTDGRWGV